MGLSCCLLSMTGSVQANQNAAMPLAAVACMSLAAKLEEVQVPNDLSSLQASFACKH